VCRRLDGITLAIELAAARVGILSPVQIAERLDDRFRLLTGGQRSLPARHQTLRALVDWSYELLAESEVMLLQRLSVFAGGWTLEAAEAVCGADGIEVAEVLDLLGQLVAKSLVLADDVPGQGYRYRMLETMREYGQERLAASGRARAFEDAHARYYLSLAEQAEPALRGPDQLHCYAHVDMEHDNFRAALVRLRAWAEEDPSAAATGLRIAERLAWYWYVRSYWNEGRDWLGYFIALAPAEGTVAARARANAAVLSWLVGDRETANAWQHESVALARATGNESAVAWCLLMLLPILFLMGDFARIEETASEAIPIFLAHDAAWETGFSTSIRGAAKVYTGDAAAGLQMIKEALELFQRSGDRWGIGYAYTHLGLAATAGKNAEQARQLLRQSVTSFEELGHKGSTTEPLARLGKLAFEQGDVHGAAREYLEALRLANEIGRRQAIGACLAGLAAIAAARGQSEEAVWLYQAAEACRQTVDVKLSPADREAEDRALANLREALGPDAFERAASQGQTMPLQEAVAVGEQVGHAAE
jgi:tetratricopeptide (TPR) repeat protein